MDDLYKQFEAQAELAEMHKQLARVREELSLAQKERDGFLQEREREAVEAVESVYQKCSAALDEARQSIEAIHRLTAVLKDTANELEKSRQDLSAWRDEEDKRIKAVAKTLDKKGIELANLVEKNKQERERLQQVDRTLQLKEESQDKIAKIQASRSASLSQAFEEARKKNLI